MYINNFFIYLSNNQNLIEIELFNTYSLFSLININESTAHQRSVTRKPSGKNAVKSL